MDISIDYLALLKQLHKIEHKHKSVMNVSDNDPDLIKLHDISHAKYWQNRKFPYVEHNLDLLRDCIDKGYSYLETAQIMGVSRSTVASYCYRHKIREQPCFKYVLSKDGHLDYYSATKLGYDYLAGLPRCVSNCSRLENHLKKAITAIDVAAWCMDDKATASILVAKILQELERNYGCDCYSWLQDWNDQLDDVFDD